MLVLFQAADPATPDREQDYLVNSRNVVLVEGLFHTVTEGGETFPMPDGSILHLTDKRKLKVKETPRQVDSKFRASGAR